MISTYGNLLKRDAWKLLAFLVILFLIQFLSPLTNRILTNLALPSKVCAILLLTIGTIVKAVSFSALALLPYWATGQKLTKETRNPWVVWTVLACLYAVINTLMGFLPTLLLIYGKMPLADIALLSSHSWIIWGILTVILFCLFFRTIVSVLERTSFWQGFLCAARHWGKLLISLVWLTVVFFSFGGIFKWLQYPLFLAFATVWMLLIYGFVAYQNTHPAQTNQ